MMDGKWKCAITCWGAGTIVVLLGFCAGLALAGTGQSSAATAPIYRSAQLATTQWLAAAKAPNRPEPSAASGRKADVRMRISFFGTWDRAYTRQSPHWEWDSPKWFGAQHDFMVDVGASGFTWRDQTDKHTYEIQARIAGNTVSELRYRREVMSLGTVERMDILVKDIPLDPDSQGERYKIFRLWGAKPKGGQANPEILGHILKVAHSLTFVAEGVTSSLVNADWTRSSGGAGPISQVPFVELSILREWIP